MMTQDEMRIAVAEWIRPVAVYGKGIELSKDDVDMNLMHEAEKKLPYPEAYASRLGAILLRDRSASNFDGTTAWHFAFCKANAAQRLEALCRTLWPERFK